MKLLVRSAGSHHFTLLSLNTHTMSEETPGRVERKLKRLLDGTEEQVLKFLWF